MCTIAQTLRLIMFQMINVYQMTRIFIWLIFLASSAMLMILHYLVVAEPLVECVNMFQ